MFHLAAYEGSIGNTADTDVSAVTDSILSIRNNHIVPPVPMQVLAVYGGGAQLLRAQMLTPKIRALSPNWVVPVDQLALPPKFARPCNFRRKPFVLNASEELQFLVTNSAAGPTATFLLAWLGITQEPAPLGETYHFRGTSTTAAVAFTWTSITMTWQNSLPAGLYAIVGGSYYAANAVGFRVIFPGGGYRPGGLGFATEAGATWQDQQEDLLGLWGTFNTVAMPNIEVFNAVTDAVHTIYLDLIKIA